MSNKILLLPDHVANQIAAGEIVQRPSSVVKELLENAVDAKSTAIKVIVKDAGSTLIQVIDNGHGMDEIDARMCFERHATSKLKTFEDLAFIKTLGFRGEALASIAAVSKIELISREANQELGTHITLSGSNPHKQVPIAAPVGTSISIKNLFFNVPARRKFLKTSSVESKHIIEAFQQAALAHPEIALDLYQDCITTYQLPAHKPIHRIIHLFGKNYQTKLLPCQTATDLIQIHGYIAPPKDAKKTRGEQFFFVNNRYIKSSYLSHAVKRAFEGLLAPDTFPFYVLYITLSPHHVDVNVHPTKTEIKFQEESLVYGTVTTAIKKALAAYHITPSLDFEQVESQTSLLSQETPPQTSQQFFSQQEKDYGLLKTLSTNEVPKTPVIMDTHQEGPKIEGQAYQTPSTLEDAVHLLTNIFQLHKKYIIAQVKSGMLLIDQRAAHERILYERILHQTKRSATVTQQLLSPVYIMLQPADLVLAQVCKKEIQALGFQFSIYPSGSISLTGLPPEAKGQSPQQLFEELLEQYKLYGQEIAIPEAEKWARSMAKRLCFNKAKPLCRLEIEAMVDQLFACQNPNYTPDGMTVWTILSLDQIASLLKRV